MTLLSINSFAQWTSDGSIITREEYKLYTIVNQYRNSKGLHAIPLSKSLTAVAQTHVKDLMKHFVQGGTGNAHSWSSYGPWTACCYTPDHAQAKHMWNKPSQITPYKGNGYEIAYWCSGTVEAEEALDGWKSSPGHHAVMINMDIWSNSRWSAMGVAIYQNYAVIWFGKETDTVRGQPQIVETEADVYNRNTSRIIYYESHNNENMTSLRSNKSTTTYFSTPNYSYSSYNNTTISNQSDITRRERFYSHASKKHTSFISVGYGYAPKCETKLFNASLLDFRYKCFGISFLNAEIGIEPLTQWIGYSPSLKFFIPMTRWLAFSINAGAIADATLVRSTVDDNFQYDMTDDFFASANGGLSLYFVPTKYTPIELKAEYRHDLYNTSPINGLVLSTILHISR